MQGFLKGANEVKGALRSQDINCKTASSKVYEAISSLRCLT